jgi:hypothetical protein
MAKRDLGKLGVTSLEQLDHPIPEGIIVNAKVAVRKNDDGTEFNRVVRFAFVAVEEPEPEPFAPSKAPPDGSTTDTAGFDWATGKLDGVPNR